MFTTSLYKINCLLKDTYAHKATPNPIEEQWQAQIAKANKLASITQDITYAKKQAC